VVGYDLTAVDPEAARTSLDSAQRHLSEVLAEAPDQVEALVEQASIMLFRDQIGSSAILLSQLENLEVPAGDLRLMGDRYMFKHCRDLGLRAYRLAIENDLNAVVAEELLRTYPELND
jgi:uncharacterized protein YijF (DUF1287 family)